MYQMYNPIPMLPRLSELDAYKYYFQFTLTGYGKDIEENLPDKKEQLIPAFQELAGRIGKKRVIWRYDPIVFTKKYTPDAVKANCACYDPTSPILCGTVGEFDKITKRKMKSLKQAQLSFRFDGQEMLQR